MSYKRHIQSFNEHISVNENFIQEVEKYAISGKNTFNCFLLSLTSLKSNIEPNWEACPNNFFIYYTHLDEKEDITEVMSRYPSLYNGIKQISNATKCGVYFGLSFNDNVLYLEYGMLSNGERILLGQFKVTDSVLIKLLNKPNKCLNSLKKELTNLSAKSIKLLMIVKKNLLEYKPGDFEKKSIIKMTSNVMNFGIYGVGKWNGTKMDPNDLEALKVNFKKWLSKFKWSDRILVSVNPVDYWVYFNIKLK